MIDTEANSKKLLIVIIGVGFCIALFMYIYQTIRVRDSFVMCDVGQGDGMYMRNGEQDIVIDAGRPTNQMANCLSHYIPYFDKTIELAFITNSDSDHYGGYFTLLDHYFIEKLIITNITDGDPMYQQLLHKFKRKHTTVEFLYAGDRILLANDATLTFLWPDSDYIKNAIISAPQQKSAYGNLYLLENDINTFSQVMLFENNKKSILFTGDVTAEIIQNYLLDSIKKDVDYPIDILKLAHHGSKNGITFDFIKLLAPKIAVVSAGYKNQFKHPSEETVALLTQFNIPYFIPFLKGNIQINTQSDSVIPSFFK